MLKSAPLSSSPMILLRRPANGSANAKKCASTSTHKQTNATQTHKQTDRQTDKQTNRQTDRQTDRPTWYMCVMEDRILWYMCVCTHTYMHAGYIHIHAGVSTTSCQIGCSGICRCIYNILPGVCRCIYNILPGAYTYIYMQVYLQHLAIYM